MKLREMSLVEQQDVNGGSLMVVAAWAILALTVAPYAVCAGYAVSEGVKAIDASFDDEREHARRRAVDDARTDYENGFTTPIY